MGELLKPCDHSERLVESSKAVRIPVGATDLEVFAIKSKEALIGFKVFDGSFHYIQVPYTEPINDPGKAKIKKEEKDITVKFITDLLEMIKLNEWIAGREAETGEAGYNYCPHCTNSDNEFKDQEKHNPGCKYVELVKQAEEAIASLL